MVNITAESALQAFFFNFLRAVKSLHSGHIKLEEVMKLLLKITSLMAWKNLKGRRNRFQFSYSVFLCREWFSLQN